MIALRIIDSGPYVDPRFLDSTDVPFILIGIIWLFIAYFKIKNKKIAEISEKETTEAEGHFELKMYDILMQPKKNNIDDKLPFINFSIPKLTVKEFILGIILFVFYYLIFTEKI